jgi:hypothetical protein
MSYYQKFMPNSHNSQQRKTGKSIHQAPELSETADGQEGVSNQRQMCDSFGHHTPHLSVHDYAMVLLGQQILLPLGPKWEHPRYETSRGSVETFRKGEVKKSGYGITFICTKIM